MWVTLINRLRSLLVEEDGPAIVEYALMLAVISMGAIVALASFGDHMDNLYLAIAGAAPSAGS